MNQEARPAPSWPGRVSVRLTTSKVSHFHFPPDALSRPSFVVGQFVLALVEREDSRRIAEETAAIFAELRFSIDSLCRLPQNRRSGQIFDALRHPEASARESRYGKVGGFSPLGRY